MSSFIESINTGELTDILKDKLIGQIIRKGIEGVTELFKRASAKINSKAEKALKKNDYEYFLENSNLEIKQSDILNHISNNVKSTSIWSKEIYFNTALNSKSLNKVFVEIDLYLSPLKFRFDESEQIKKIKGSNILKDFNNNKIIYGGAGAGKTTFVKKICSDYLEDTDKYPFTCPVVIRFREIDYENQTSGKYFGLFSILIDVLGIQIKFPFDKIPSNKVELFYNEYSSLIKQTVISFLDDCKILLIADGFDEIPDSVIKKKIEKEFEELALGLENARFILTTRSNDFTLKLPQTDNYEICPLNDGQIKKLIRNWLNDKKKSDNLYDEIKKSPYFDTTMRPLTLSHLCAIYERRKSIPPKPRYIHDFVLNLLLESWDQQRSIIRPSEYAEFYIEKKKEFLANLAFWFTYNLNRNVFTTDELIKCYNIIHKAHNLPHSQAKKIVRELENHTGLFVQIGYNSYEFSHRSLQEFLTAKYIHSLLKIPEPNVLNKLPNETAISVSLSSSPNIYFEYFIKDYKNYSAEYWNIFIGRLADESPDFDENPSVIIFFLIAMNSLKYAVFYETLPVLIERTNLKISIRNFLKLYPERNTYNNETRFTYFDIKTPLNERNNFPSVLIASNRIVELIDKFKINK